MAASIEDRGGDPVRWLTSDEERAWRQAARLLYTLPVALEAQLQRDANLSYIEYNVLARLSEDQERTVRMSVLADFVCSSLSRLSHLMKRLEARGFVRREPDPSDGRFTNAILTSEGHKALIEAAPGHVAAVRSLVTDVLTAAELRQLEKISRRLLTNVEPASHLG
jgi:DNA-binding MarR family transcriptional regulator